MRRDAEQPDETAEARARRLSSAERAHEAHARDVATSFAPLVAMGTELLKAVALLNGGAGAATILFVALALKDERALAQALVGPLSCFGFGLAVATFATGWSYFSQAQHGLALTLRQRIWSEPFLADTLGSKEASRRGDRFQSLALAAVFVAMGSAVVGFMLAGAILLFTLR